MWKLIGLATALGTAAGCACAYGGPGCDDPAVFGACAGMVPLGRTVATVTFFDDTGEHPSGYRDVVAVPDDRLQASHGAELGSLELVGLAEGAAEFRLSGVDGWEDTTFYYAVAVTATAAQCEPEEAMLPTDRSP